LSLRDLELQRRKTTEPGKTWKPKANVSSVNILSDIQLNATLNTPVKSAPAGFSGQVVHPLAFTNP
jgi:hypothetical protein